MSSVDGAFEQGREALRRFLVGDIDLNSMLTQIALVAAETVPGCDTASVTMLRQGVPTTPVFTDNRAIELDETQYRLGDGPCLSAIRHHGPEHISIGDDERWPTFRRDALRRGVTAVLSVPLIREEAAVGALNLYSATTSAYSDDARETASLLADQLGVAAANVVTYVDAYELSRQLRQALESRAVIEQAKGILIADQGCTADDAFDILRRASQRENRKLRAVATDIVDGRSHPRGP